MRKVTIFCTLFYLLFTFTANAQSERDSSFTIPADTLDESIGIALEQKADSAIKAEKPIKIKKKRDFHRMCLCHAMEQPDVPGLFPGLS